MEGSDQRKRATKPVSLKGFLTILTSATTRVYPSLRFRPTCRNVWNADAAPQLNGINHRALACFCIFVGRSTCFLAVNQTSCFPAAPVYRRSNELLGNSIALCSSRTMSKQTSQRAERCLAAPVPHLGLLRAPSRSDSWKPSTGPTLN